MVLDITLSSSVWRTKNMHTEPLQIHLCECSTSVNKVARVVFFYAVAALYLTRTILYVQLQPAL